jgi:predicted HTH transcriptional regulator
MNDALFDPNDVREDIDLEAKRAAGRDGRGAVPKSLFETYSAFANTDGGVTYNNSGDTNFLRQLGGWRRDRDIGREGLTLAGLLMFGQLTAIQEAVTHYFVDYRELPVSGSKTEWIDRLMPDGTWSGNLYDFYRLTIQRLFRDLKVPFHLEGAQREDDTPVHKALREALVNAIVHADYSERLSVLVVKAPDYFGFRNPGRMRITIDKALQGGHSDCRNRSLQRMFSLIGLGEQAGSGIPRVLENWKSQHYRFPELWESEEPEATMMRLRTVSLLPEATLEALHARFGPAFEGLSEDARLALATAEIEGFVSNIRLQQITSLHPRDITALLRSVVDGGFLIADGHGRATTYRVAGTPSDDRNSKDLSLSSVHIARSTTHLDDSTTHLDDSTTHLGGSTTHLGNISTQLDNNPSTNPELLTIAEAVRTKGKTSIETTRLTILRLCEGRFLTVAELATLLNRSAQGLRERFVKPMTDAGLLERRFPNQPSHEQQAYRSKEASE